MSSNIEKFKVTVINLLPKNDADTPLDEDAINSVIEDVYAARTVLKIDISSETLSIWLTTFTGIDL